MSALLQSFSLELWILQCVSLAVTAFLLPGLRVTSIAGPLAAVIALAFVNAHLWSVELFFELPTSLSERTLILFGVNGFIFWLIVKVTPGIEVDGFIPALLAPILFTICSVLILRYGAHIDWANIFSQLQELVHSFRDSLQDTSTTGAASPVTAPIPAPSPTPTP